MELMMLPSELLAGVLILLDFWGLLRCREVCTGFKTLIDEDARAQYILELAVAGMEDGPPSTLTTADRLSILRTHRDAWSKFAWTAKVVVPMYQNNVWRPHDSVLAQSEGNGMLHMKRMPSRIRGIEGIEWVIPELGREIIDIGIDSAQDLLIIVERFSGDGFLLGYRIHLRALSTNEPHPAGPRAAMLILRSTPRAYLYPCQTSADYLGILISLRGQEDEELLIWEWKIGALRLRITGLEVSSWGFLTSRFLLVSQTAPEFDYENRRTVYWPQLIVIDIDNAPSSDPVALSELDYTCAFHYPPFAENVVVHDMTIQPESGSNACSSPRHCGAVPFLVSSEHRLFLITIWVSVCHEEVVLRLLVPMSTFLQAVATLAPGETRRAFAWPEWGPCGSRLMRMPSIRAPILQGGCHVYGTMFATIEVDIDARAQVADHDARTILVMRDFNQRAIRRRQRAGCVAGDKNPAGGNSEEQDQNGRLVASATAFEPADIFREEVTTALPYVERRFMLPQEEEGEDAQPDALMLAEDALVLVMGKQDSQLQCRIFSF